MSTHTGIDRPVVIELDAPLTTLDPLRSGDYLERCVVSALHHPVLRLSSASERHDQFEFVVPDGRRFSDGLAVQADHALRTLVESASSPLWARYIRYLERAEVAGDRVSLTMRHPANFYPAMLQMVDFAPMHPDGESGSGPYQIGSRFDAERQYYHLSPNAHFPGAQERPDVVFVVGTDVDGAPDRFRCGEVDITCSTAFPLSRLGDWRGSGFLHSAPTGIHMQLEPNPEQGGSLADSRVRTELLDCLDLDEIAANFDGGLRPAAFPVGASGMQRGTVMPARITIAYHDFYPNRLIMELIARQWQERLGIRTELAERDYADPSRDGVDASFVLRYPAFNHPYAVFDQCETVMPDPALQRLLRGFAAGEPGSRDAVVSHLRATAPILRLFEVVGHWLAHPRVTGFRWPSDAVFDFTGLRCPDECPS